MEGQVYRWGAAGRGFGPGARKFAPKLGEIGCAWVSLYGVGRKIARTAATIDGVYEGRPPGEGEGLEAADYLYSGDARHGYMPIIAATL